MTALADYPRVAPRIPAGSHGVAEVCHQHLDAADAAAVAYSFNGAFPVDHGVSAALKIAGETFMSDLEYERTSCLELAHHARGDVLIAGLGLGMVLPPLLDDASVDAVTVVEKVRDVITLIAPYYAHPKLHVIHADVLTWEPGARSRWHTIYFDIWPRITPMNLVQITYLHRSFARALAPAGWMESWMRRHLLRRMRDAARAAIDPGAEIVGTYGAELHAETPATAAKLLGLLRRMRTMPLDLARRVATAAPTHSSVGTTVLAEEGPRC